MSSTFKNTVFNPAQATTAQRINPLLMEEQLARELARNKQAEEKRKREIEVICSQSDELKELQ
jgi:hypothetical protein